MNISIMQDILNAVLGEGVLELANVDSNLLFLGSVFLMYFCYIALRSMLRFFLGLGTKF